MDTVKEWRARVRSVLRVFLVAAGLAMPCFADTVYDCFEVKLYSPSWHVKSTLNGFTDKIDIAIDDNVHNDGMRLTITSIIIPNSISNIGYKAFSGCTGIPSFSVPSSVTNLSESAFFRLQLSSDAVAARPGDNRFPPTRCAVVLQLVQMICNLSEIRV